MGFFSTNQEGKSNKVAEELATNVDETNKELENILSRFLNNQDKFDDLSDQLLLLSKKLNKKLSDKENEKLCFLTETVNDLQEEYLNTFRVIATLQEKQQLRVDAVDDKYKKIVKKASQKYAEARSLYY
ncbi:hypothetical protein [uncultured Marixanthomonas sp.]|uniref:hypothetical protein n=1 Tax=uncultured Marixanthomonas sp. TaxID=757245 RepID=UPI0030D9367D|tara:strand:+ start:883 stop:1269 length:387 start_codon:yes stop_codon:yes gene_type:complete